MKLPKLSKAIKKHWHLAIVIPLAICFFFGTSFYNYKTQTYSQNPSKTPDFVKWASPDGTANYIFTKLYAQEGSPTLEEKYNRYTGDIMHPRSFRSDHGTLKPVSFLGIILIYGKIAHFTSYKIIPYLTPFFASLAIIFFYLLVSKIFNKKNALLSTIILSCFPPFIYYTARSMFHNVLFLSLLIIGLYFAILMKETEEEYKIKRTKYQMNWKRGVMAILAGLFIGGSIITRSSELIWLGPYLFILWIFNFKRIGLTRLIIFLSFSFLAILPSLYWNQILYNSPIAGGYSEMNSSISNIGTASTDIVKSLSTGKFNEVKSLTEKIKSAVFYFGIHPKFSLKMFNEYFIKMFYWIFWPAILGFCLYLTHWKEYNKKVLAYILSMSLCAFVLTLYYGSWVFHDNPDPNSFTIGNSYTRYWLPFYLGALPFASFLILKTLENLKFIFSKLPRKFTNKYLNFHTLRFIILSSIIIFTYYTSINFVLYGSAEGLVHQAQRTNQSRTEWEKILSLTENNSTIITKYHDKLFFPERKVIVGLFNDKNMNQQYSTLAKLLPVYYYNFTLPQKDLDYLNTRRLKEYELTIELVEKITKDFSLYKISTIKD